jgi:hypothetical protein
MGCFHVLKTPRNLGPSSDHVCGCPRVKGLAASKVVLVRADALPSLQHSSDGSHSSSLFKEEEEDKDKDSRSIATTELTLKGTQSTEDTGLS